MGGGATIRASGVCCDCDLCWPDDNEWESEDEPRFLTEDSDSVDSPQQMGVLWGSSLILRSESFM